MVNLYAVAGYWSAQAADARARAAAFRKQGESELAEFFLEVATACDGLVDQARAAIDRSSAGA